MSMDYQLADSDGYFLAEIGRRAQRFGFGFNGQG
jgi:hypothetical protein